MTDISGSPSGIADTSVLSPGTPWHLLAYRTTEGDEIVLLPVDGAAAERGSMQTLTFSGTDVEGTLETTGYCAPATARYTLEDDALATFAFDRTGGYGCTGVPYDDEAIWLAGAALEDAFDDEATLRASRREERLVLDADDGRRLVLGPRPPGGAAPLFPFADTAWTLETIRSRFDGSYPNLAPLPVAPPVRLRFVADVSNGEGPLEIDYGCRRFEGRWVLEEGILGGTGATEIDPDTSPGCAAATDAQLDPAFVPALLDAVLRDATAVTIDGDELYLSDGSGTSTTLVLAGHGPDPDEEAVVFETLFRGDRARGANVSTDVERRLVVYRDQESLDAAFASLEAETGSRLGPAPTVDFAANVVVVGFLAIDGDTSDDIAPRAANASPGGLEVVLAIREEIPDQLGGDCVAEEAISGPFVFVRVESRAEPVRLVERVTSFCAGLMALP